MKEIFLSVQTRSGPIHPPHWLNIPLRLSPTRTRIHPQISKERENPKKIHSFLQILPSFLMRSCVGYCNRPVIVAKSMENTSSILSAKRISFGVAPRDARSRIGSRACRGVRASVVDSYENSSDFVKRMEQAWLISQQPRPIACSSCESNGHVECQWCRGTGFFILGDNMLCQVPSRNTTCVICAGKGSMRCSDCKGTGFRAKWLGKPPISK